MDKLSPTYLARQNLFVVDVCLHPRHELFDVCWGGHLGRSFVVLIILPEVLEPVILD